MAAALDAKFKAAIAAKALPAVGALAVDKAGDIIYKGAFGTTNISDPSAAPFTSSTPFILWSCTKLATCIAALQLLEQGKLDLDDPVEKYLPRMKERQVLEGFHESGAPIFRAPKTKATILHLMTHTSGLSYDYMNEKTFKWRATTNLGYMAAYAAIGKLDCFLDPLAHDPGEKFSYGIGIDWLGMVVEAISGVSLPEYVKANITDPLEMHDTGAHVSRPKLVSHTRLPDGSLQASPEFGLAENPEVYGGGHYLYSTLDDWVKLLLALLNDGVDPKSGARILREETVRNYVFEDQLPKITGATIKPGTITSYVPIIAPPFTDYIPGKKKGWSCTFCLATEGSGKGRRPGTGGWCGIANLFYWVDREAGKAAFFVTEVSPFADEVVLALCDEFEKVIYGDC